MTHTVLRKACTYEGLRVRQRISIKFFTQTKKRANKLPVFLSFNHSLLLHHIRGLVIHLPEHLHLLLQKKLPPAQGITTRSEQ